MAGPELTAAELAATGPAWEPPDGAGAAAGWESADRETGADAGAALADGAATAETADLAALATDDTGLAGAEPLTEGESPAELELLVEPEPLVGAE